MGRGIILGEFLGATGGVLMIALIVVLAFRFITDTFVSCGMSTIRSISRYSAVALSSGIILIICGGIIYNFIYGKVAVSDIATIWNYPPVGTFFGTSEGSFVLPLYPALTSLFSGLLFDKYVECATYISLLSGVITGVCLGMYLEKRMSYQDAMQYILSCMCIPGAVFLFLPSPLALFMALFSLSLLCMDRGHVVCAAFFAVLCMLTHLSGVCAIVLWTAGFIYKKENRYASIVYAACVAITQLIVCISCMAAGYTSFAEYILVFIVPACMVLRPYKNLIYINVILVILSGFYMTAMMYGYI